MRGGQSPKNLIRFLKPLSNVYMKINVLNGKCAKLLLLIEQTIRRFQTTRATFVRRFQEFSKI